MIDAKTLQKNNLKAVPFSHIREGETFNIKADFLWPDYVTTTRKLENGNVFFADDKLGTSPLHRDHTTVYVPVWRPTSEELRK